MNLNWTPPDHWTRIATVDMHTGGEPLRVLISGVPPIEGNTVLEKRRYFREHLDHIRTATMWEPRGHADMYGAVITPSLDADFDAFFLHNEGYSTMCGHAIIALTKLAYETGLVPKIATSISINVPAGKIVASAIFENDRVVSSSFRNVPSFVYLRDQEVLVPDVGSIRFDVAYGGAFYALVEAESLELQLLPGEVNKLIEHGRRIKRAVMDSFAIAHPFEPDLSFLYGTIFTGKSEDPIHHSRNVCIFAEGEVDRSPTGSGVSARAALHYARGELRVNEKITIESVLGSTMGVEVVETTKYGAYNAVIPEVSGSASFVGKSEFCLDPDDPLRNGFLLR
jgi:proline racemase